MQTPTTDTARILPILSDDINQRDREQYGMAHNARIAIQALNTAIDNLPEQDNANSDYIEKLAGWVAQMEAIREEIRRDAAAIAAL